MQLRKCLPKRSFVHIL